VSEARLSARGCLDKNSESYLTWSMFNHGELD
jgi:hypothetical protein